ncbi:MAG: peptidoglycan-binding protein [Candidatus Omnitrophica bacterium]|nr:peptidoglycan-binding protein [Candidatus Omnitrophota bacterium]
MKKFIIFALVFLQVAAGIVIIPPSCEASPGLYVTAPSAILIDPVSKHVIFAKSPHLKRKAASTTKLMTALVVLKKLPLDKEIVITRQASCVAPSKVHLKQGERYTAGALLEALLMESANDAAVALAEGTAGSNAAFARLMNEEARRVGARDTHFANPHGLPGGEQYTTAYDLALIVHELRKKPFLVRLLKKRYSVIYSANGRRIHLKNHNRMLWRRNRPVIGKTGFTRKARHCFAGRIQRGSGEVLVVIMGSHRLWSDLKTLIDFALKSDYMKCLLNQRCLGNSRVLRLQAFLRRKGYKAGPRDGKFGKATLDAVKRFQKHNGLSPDGIVGPRTWRLIATEGCSS